MRITPLDIRKQEFRKVMRGLDPEEVYAFLTTVADEYEAALSDNKALRERLLELDDKVQEYRNMEKTLRNTLLTAERVTVEAKENARREADLIIKEAEIEAEKALRDIKNKAMKLRQEIQELKRQKESYVTRLKMMVESHLKFIDSAEEDLTEEVGGERTSGEAPTEKEGERVPWDKRGFEPTSKFPSERRDSTPKRSGRATLDADKPGTGVEGATRPLRPRTEESPGESQQKGPSSIGRNEFGGIGEGMGKTEVVMPDLNSILDRMIENQEQTLRTDPPGDVRKQEVKKGEKGEHRVTSLTEEVKGLVDPLRDSEVAGEGRPEEERPEKGKRDVGFEGSGGKMAEEEKWSLEKLKRDILADHAGDDEEDH